MESIDCTFCNIIDKKENAYIIYEDEILCCFLDIDPINEGHVLIVPKKHCDSIEKLDGDTMLRIMKVSKMLYKAIKNIYNCDGYTMMQNGEVFSDFGHYHMHLFPRYKEDGFGWKCKELINPNSLETVSNKIKFELNKI